jgi:hypothetical protein
MGRRDGQFHAPPPVKQDNAVILHDTTGEAVLDVQRRGAVIMLNDVALSAESVRRLQVIVTEALAWGMRAHTESEQGT